MKAKPFLLDVNLLLALAWPNRLHHRDAAFANRRRHGFHTCPITQAGFVRISTNPAFKPDAVPPLQAVDLLARIAALDGHGFWPDDLSVTAAIGGRGSSATAR